jgi:hypothetical protein
MVPAANQTLLSEFCLDGNKYFISRYDAGAPNAQRCQIATLAMNHYVHHLLLPKVSFYYNRNWHLWGVDNGGRPLEGQHLTKIANRLLAEFHMHTANGTLNY